MRRLLLNAFLALNLILLATACDVSDNSSTGTLQVILTDAPANYESVMIDIPEVRLHDNSDAEDDDSGWRIINDQPIRLDLLELTNGSTEILGEEELEAGTYNQLRLILGDQNEIVVDG